MNRKKFAKVIGLILCLVLVPFLTGTSHAQKPIELAFALHTAPGGPEHLAVQKFKEMVESRSKNRLKVNLFPGAALGGERDNLEQLKLGEVALTLSGGLDISLYAPEYALNVPFVFPNLETVFKAWDGWLGSQVKKAHLEKGKVHIVGIHRRGSRMLTANKEIKTPADLKGVKLRLPEIPDWVAIWKELGALPTVVAWPEVFFALQTGVVEAQENPISLIYTTKLNEVQKYLMLTAHLHNTFQWLMSDKVLSALPEDLKDIVLKAAGEASRHGDKITKEMEEDFKKELAGKGMKIVAVDTKLFETKAQPAIEKIRAKWAKGVYEEVVKLTGAK